MHTASHSHRARTAPLIHWPLLALVCASLYSGAAHAAPDVLQGQPLAPAAQGSATATATASVNHSSTGTVRRMALAGVLGAVLWHAWRGQGAEPAATGTGQPATVTGPAAAPAAPPVLALHDPDRPIAMEGVDKVGDLRGTSVRRLMDTLRDLRVRKDHDCRHGRTYVNVLCAKIALIKAALRGHGLDWFGDEARDGCDCH